MNRIEYAASPNYADDIEGGEDDNAFIYDEIGNLTYDNKQNTHFIWSVYGKMSSAKKVVNPTKTTVSEFGYDAQQNRYKKDNYSILTNRFAHTITQTHDVSYYIRDAQGNVLAIYNKQHNTYYNTETGENSQQTYHLNQKEQHLYGSSRLGIVQLDRQMSMMSWSGADLITQNQGIRNYELTNHLGNVLSTITDKGVITSAQDYYPFGLTLASRSFTEGGSVYRYSFNGKEDDKELKQQDYGFRINRPDLGGRFLSVDPLMSKYPELSPYQFASNRPIQGIDLDGLEFSEAPSGQLSQMIKIGKTSVVTEKTTEKTMYFAKDLTNRTGWILEVRSLETNDKRTFHYTEDTKTTTDAKNWKEYDQHSYNKTLYKAADQIAIGTNYVAAGLLTGGVLAEIGALPILYNGGVNALKMAWNSPVSTWLTELNVTTKIGIAKGAGSAFADFMVQKSFGTKNEKLNLGSIASNFVLANPLVAAFSASFASYNVEEGLSATAVPFVGKKDFGTLMSETAVGGAGNLMGDAIFGLKMGALGKMFGDTGASKLGLYLNGMSSFSSNVVGNATSTLSTQPPSSPTPTQSEECSDQ